jgi:arylsulfatase A-like enzyme
MKTNLAILFLLAQVFFQYCKIDSFLVNSKDEASSLPILNIFYPHPSLAWEISLNEDDVDYSNFTRTKDPWNRSNLPIYVEWKRANGVENFTKYLILGGKKSLAYTFPSSSYQKIVSDEIFPKDLEISCNGYPLQWKKNLAKLICGQNVSKNASLRIYNPTDSEIAIPYIQILPKKSLAKNLNPKTNLNVKSKVNKVIFIVIDSLRFDAIGKKGVTPYLDRFQKEFISFNKHLVNSAWTRPSTTIFFTGQYASKSTLNFWDYPLPVKEAEAFYNSILIPLPQNLSKEGFHSTMIGNNPFVTDRFGIGVDYGFQSIEEFSRSPNDTILIKESALRYLRKIQKTSSKEFLFLNFNDPHKPYTPDEKYTKRIIDLNPEEFQSKDPRILDYLGEVAFVDEQLGEIFQEMKRLGIWEESMIIITSDHGEVMNENHAISLFTGTNTLFGHGQSLYQEDIHVPLLIKYPSNVGYNLKSGSKISALTRSIDIFPTILETVLAEKSSHSHPPEVDGISLNRILDQTETTDREYYGETRATQAVQIKDWKLMRKSFLFHRLGFWRGYVGTEKDYLFNLKDDPLEENPIWIDKTSLAPNPIYKELKDKLESYSKPNSHYTIRISNPNIENNKNLNIQTESPIASTKKIQIQIRISSGEVRSVHKMSSEPLVSKNEFSIIVKPGEVKEFHFQVYPDISFPSFQIWVDDKIANPSDWGVGALDLNPKGCFGENCSALFDAKNGSPNQPNQFRIQIWRSGNGIISPGIESDLGADAIGILKKQGYIQ